MGIGGGQRHTAKTAGHQAAQEGRPAGTVLGGAQVQPQALAAPVGVDAHGVHDGDVADTPALAHLNHQSVEHEVGIDALDFRQLKAQRENGLVRSSTFLGEQLVEQGAGCDYAPAHRDAVLQTLLNSDRNRMMRPLPSGLTNRGTRRRLPSGKLRSEPGGLRLQLGMLRVSL